MAAKEHGVGRNLIHVGGWQLVKRGAKMLPFGGTVLAVGLVGHDIKRKGLVKGVINSGLDAIPGIGLVKNGIEMFIGDFLPDKDNSKRKGTK